MITTVTTVTTVTTIAVMGISAVTAVVSVAVVIALICFLTTKELAGAADSRFSWRIARFVSVGILPLVMTFAAIVIVKIAELL